MNLLALLPIAAGLALLVKPAGVARLLAAVSLVPIRGIGVRVLEVMLRIVGFAWFAAGITAAVLSAAD